MGTFTATRYGRDLPTGVYNRLVTRVFESFKAQGLENTFTSEVKGRQINLDRIAAVSLTKNAYGDAFERLGELGGQTHLEAMLELAAPIKGTARKAFASQAKHEYEEDKIKLTQSGRSTAALREIITGVESDLLHTLVLSCSFDYETMAKYLVEAGLSAIGYIMTNRGEDLLSPMLLINLTILNNLAKYSDISWALKYKSSKAVTELMKKAITKQPLEELLASVAGEERVDTCIDFLSDVTNKSLGVAFYEHMELFTGSMLEDDENEENRTSNKYSTTLKLPDECSDTQVKEIMDLVFSSGFVFLAEQVLADLYIIKKNNSGLLELDEDKRKEVQARIETAWTLSSVCAITSIRLTERGLLARINNLAQLLSEQLEKYEKSDLKQKQINSTIKSEIKQCKKDAEALRTELRQKDLEITKLKARIDFSVNPEEYKDMRDEIEKLKTALENSDTVYRDTKRSLTKREKDVASYEETVAALNKRIEELEVTNSSMKGSNDELLLHRAYNQIPVESFVAAIRDKKIVVIGGNMMHTKIQNYGLPGCKLIEANSKYVGFEEIANADLLVIASAFVDHSTVEQPVRLAKQHGINLLRYDNKNADMLIYAMFSAIYK